MLLLNSLNEEFLFFRRRGITGQDHGLAAFSLVDHCTVWESGAGCPLSSGGGPVASLGRSIQTQADCLGEEGALCILAVGIKDKGMWEIVSKKS